MSTLAELPVFRDQLPFSFAGEDMVEFFLIVIIAVVVVTVTLMMAQSKARKSLRDTATDWMSGSGFRSYRVMFRPGDGIGIDYERRRVAFASGGEHRIVDFDDLVSVEIAEDGKSVITSNRGSQLLGAAVGAAAFGGIGAIVGGLSGSSSSAMKVGRVSINVITRDPNAPFFEIKVYHDQPTEKGGFVYNQMTKDLMPWFGRLKAILDSPHEPSTIPKPEATSSADEASRGARQGWTP